MNIEIQLSSEQFQEALEAVDQIAVGPYLGISMDMRVKAACTILQNAAVNRFLDILEERV